MHFSTSILGRSVVAWLQARQGAAILTIGRDTFDRAALAGVSCYHFVAAANLSRILTHELQVQDTRDLFDHVDPARLALPRLGPVALAVLGAAFEARGIGGEAPLEKWFAKHRDAPCTFATIKLHAHDKKDARAHARPRRSRRR